MADVRSSGFAVRPTLGAGSRRSPNIADFAESLEFRLGPYFGPVRYLRHISAPRIKTRCVATPYKCSVRQAVATKINSPCEVRLSARSSPKGAGSRAIPPEGRRSIARHRAPPMRGAHPRNGEVPPAERQRPRRVRYGIGAVPNSGSSRAEDNWSNRAAYWPHGRSGGLARKHALRSGAGSRRPFPTTPSTI